MLTIISLCTVVAIISASIAWLRAVSASLSAQAELLPIPTTPVVRTVHAARRAA